MRRELAETNVPAYLNLTFELVEFSLYNLEEEVINMYTSIQPSSVYLTLRGCWTLNQFLDKYHAHCKTVGCDETRETVEARLAKVETNSICVHAPGDAESHDVLIMEDTDNCEDHVASGTAIALILFLAINLLGNGVFISKNCCNGAVTAGKGTVNLK